MENVLEDAWIIFLNHINEIYYHNSSQLADFLNTLAGTLKDIDNPGVDRYRIDKFTDEIIQFSREGSKFTIGEIIKLTENLYNVMDSKFRELADLRDTNRRLKNDSNNDINPYDTEYLNQRIASMNDSENPRKVFIFYYRLLLLRFIGGVYVLPVDFLQILAGKEYDDELTRLFNVPNGFHDTQLFGGFKSKLPPFIVIESESPVKTFLRALELSVENLDYLVGYIYRQKLAGKAYKKTIDINTRLKKEAVELGSVKWKWMNEDFDIIKKFIEIENRNERKLFYDLLTQQFPRNAEQFTESNKAVKDYFNHVYNYYNKFKKVPEDTFEFINFIDTKAMAKYFKVKNYLKDSIMELEI